MGIFSSIVQSPKKNKVKKDRSLYFEWDVPIPREELKKYSISPVFKQSHESFIAYINRKLGTLYIYCCSALQWHYDESFNMKIEIRPDSFKCKKKHRIKTVACFTKKNPFVAISMNIKPIYYAINITLPPNYPYSRKDLYLGLKNSGSTCYMSSVLQVLFHIGAFRQLIYSFKDPNQEAPAALQHLFVQLQIASRPLSLDNFITALGSVSEMSFQQQDAHEFLVALLERLETDLGKPFSESISQLFEIKMRKVIKQRKQTQTNSKFSIKPSSSIPNVEKNDSIKKSDTDKSKKNKKISRANSITALTNNAIDTVKNQIKKINILSKKDDDDQDDINNFEESDDEYEYEYQYEEEDKPDTNKQNQNQNNNNNTISSENNNDIKNKNEICNNKNNLSVNNNNVSVNNNNVNVGVGASEEEDENSDEIDHHKKRVRIRVRVEKKDRNMRIVSKFEETFMFLPITVDGISSLHDSLKKMLEPENLTDYEGGPAIQESKFIRMPPILILQLCRYKYSTETKSVIELTTPFNCPNSIRIGGSHYFLFAVVSHSGSPTFGHYLSFIKIHLGKQWFAFDDTQVSKIGKKDVKDSFELKGKSKFKTLTFGCPRAYIVFYCREDSINLITATDSIPLYLAPHKTNRFYSHFIFYDQLKGSEVNKQRRPVEWSDPTMSIYEILSIIRGKNFQQGNSTTSIIINKNDYQTNNNNNNQIQNNNNNKNETKINNDKNQIQNNNNNNQVQINNNTNNNDKNQVQINNDKNEVNTNDNDEKNKVQNNTNDNDKNGDKISYDDDENISLKEIVKQTKNNNNNVNKINYSSSSGNTINDMIKKYSSNKFSSDSDEEDLESSSTTASTSSTFINMSRENYSETKGMKELIYDTCSNDNKTDSNHIPLAFSAWAMLPGKSQFIGPLSLDMPASAFVVQGHPTEFFILPGELDNGPIFVESNNLPRIYIDVCLMQNLPHIGGYELLYKLKEVPKELSDGSYVIMKANSNKTLNINGFKLSFPRKASYSDVQTKLGVLLDQNPEKIILLRNKNEPMKPQKYPFVSTFPSNKNEHLEYQILTGKATACSVSLYTPISFIFISPMNCNHHIYYKNEGSNFVRNKNSAVVRTKKPVWFEKNVRCKEIIEFVKKNIVELEMNKQKTKICLCCKGFESFVIKPLSENYCPHKTPLRIDVVDYEIPSNKWELKSKLNNDEPMSIEVRFTKDLKTEEFVGTSRLIGINKDSKTEDVIKNIQKLNNIKNEDLLEMKVILFVIQKISVQEDLNIDDNLYSKLKEIVDQFTIPKMRACIAFVLKNYPNESLKENKSIARSLSDFL